MTRSLFMIGITYGAIANLDTFGPPIPPPKSTFSQYSGLVQLANGTTRGMGTPIATWRWGFLSQEQRDRLRLFCPTSSATVFIRTYTKESADVTAYYQAVMHWPALEEEVDTTRRIDFVVKFTDMVLQTPP